MYNLIKRIFDFFLASVLLLVFFPVFLIIAIMIKVNSRGGVFYTSKRIGLNNKVFLMPKFRSMKSDTPEVATHLLTDSQDYLTPIGKFLRKSSLDELPQLISIFKGDMSFVGPRPALFNQEDLIKLRTEKCLHEIVPGLTGWAQINGRDILSVEEKVEYDMFYLRRRSFVFDIKIIVCTFFYVFQVDKHAH